MEFLIYGIVVLCFFGYLIWIMDKGDKRRGW
jgi:hypothetical protein